MNQRAHALLALERTQQLEVALRGEGVLVEDDARLVAAKRRIAERPGLAEGARGGAAPAPRPQPDAFGKKEVASVL